MAKRKQTEELVEKLLSRLPKRTAYGFMMWNM